MKSFFHFRFYFFSFVIGVLFGLSACTGESNQSESEFQTFIDDVTAKLKPLNEKHQLSVFTASVSGDANDYKNAADLQVLIVKLFSNKDSFLKLKQWKESNLIEDSLLKRQLEVLYYQFLPYQANEQDMIDIVMLQNEIERKFAVYRPMVNNKVCTDNEIDEILANSQNEAELESYWKASKMVGKEVNDDIIHLVKLRNKIAKEAGYKNFHDMSLLISGENPEVIDSIFEELDFSTRGAYTQLKSEIDNFLSIFLNKPVDKLMPWDYQNKFFQDAPKIYNINFDKYFKENNIPETCRNFYAGIGMDMNDVLKKSNLTYEEKKQQLPFSIDIDRQGDVRISAGIDYNAQSMYALLYETGFSASYKYINKDLPYILKQPSHFIISDAGAQLFGQMTSNPAWLETQINLSKTETDAISNGSKKHTALSKFIFSRWALVMYHFEKNLYADPEQDMNKLWWNLAERYQMLKKPEDRNEPDWASKPHIVSQACQYHNYMLGEMLASQIKNYILKTHGKKSVDFDASCLKNKELGKYFIEKLYAPGLSVPWTILIKNATGQELSTEYFTKEYIDK